MKVNYIFSGIFYKNKFAIGKDNDLLVKIKEDLQFFKTTTTNTVVVMGRRCWESLGKKSLSNRNNIVITHDPDKYIAYSNQHLYFMTLASAKLYCSAKSTVYVIGGSHIFNAFPDPHKIFITHIVPDNKYIYQDADTFVNVPDNNYRLIGYSPTHSYTDGSCSGSGTYRHLIYKKEMNQYNNINFQYEGLCRNILDNGEERGDRTGVGTISLFGVQLRIDLTHGFPLLTTKYIPWKHVVEELLWFMRGDTDSKILENKGVTIWKGNTSREFLDSKGLTEYRPGVLGKGYGWQFRFFGAKYDQKFSNTLDAIPEDGFDQLQYIINEIKTNPCSRRILMCYWNPCDLDKVALPPCHYACQFYVRRGKFLDCMFSMRSTDVALGLPFNIASYAILTMIIAKKCNLEAGHLLYNGGDVHLYKTHVDSIKQQLTRSIRPLPTLVVNDVVVNKPINEISIDDFELIGYFPHPTIKMTMAV